MGCIHTKVTHVQILSEKSASVVLGSVDSPTPASDKKLDKGIFLSADCIVKEDGHQRPVSEPRQMLVQVQTTDSVTNVVNTDVVLNRLPNSTSSDLAKDPPASASASAPPIRPKPETDSDAAHLQGKADENRPDESQENAQHESPMVVEQEGDADAAGKLQAALRAQIARKNKPSSYDSPRRQNMSRTRSLSSESRSAKVSPKSSLNLIPSSPYVSSLKRHETEATNATDTTGKASDVDSVLSDKG